MSFLLQEDGTSKLLQEDGTSFLLRDESTVLSTDSVTVSDSVSGKTVVKGVADSVTVTDSTAKSGISPKADSVTVTDSVGKKVVKPLADSVTATDGVGTKADVKHLTDSVTVTDSVAKRAVKAVTDSVTVTDGTSAPAVVGLWQTKKVFYKVYDRMGNYLTTWDDDVTSDLGLAQKINSAGSTVSITLSRPADVFGEGYDVDYLNEVHMFIVDWDSPSGFLYAKGFISNYNPDYTKDQVDVNVMGFGYTMKDYVLQSGELVDQSQNISNAYLGIGNTGKGSGASDAVFSFKSGAGVTSLSSIELKMALVSALYSPVSVEAVVYASEANAKAQTSPLSSQTISVNTLVDTVYKLTLPSILTITPLTTYWVRVSPLGFAVPPGVINLSYENTNVYANGLTEYYDPSTSAWTTITGDIYFNSYSGTGNTQPTYSSVDPSDMLRSVIDDLHSHGCPITYTADSIDDTGTLVSYQFNVNNGQECVDKVLELCPTDWYYYIDQATNVFHLHQKGSLPDYVFTMGKEVKSLSILKTAEKIVNVIYFVGGDIGGGVKLLKKYTQDSSVTAYGEHAMVLSDGRVITDATASILANSAFSGTPIVQLTVEIIDNTQNADLGYDIESVVLGKIAKIANLLPTGISSGITGSLFGTAEFDEGSFDYNLADLSSLVLQVIAFDYKPDYIAFVLSTERPDVTKRIEDVKRNLKTLELSGTPGAPT